MKTENKNRWVVWALVALAVLNITTLITMVYHKNHVIEQEVVTAPDSINSEKASVLYSGRYFREELNLSNEQMNKFSQFNPEFRQEVRRINLLLTEKRHAMLIEMAEDKSDKNKLNLLSDSIGYLHASPKKVTYIYYLNFKNICNREQQKKLEQLFGEMFNNDTQMVQPGAGNPGGRRYGWRNKN
jgi:Spy/CpxP family protein refolding chaperone